MGRVHDRSVYHVLNDGSAPPQKTIATGQNSNVEVVLPTAIGQFLFGEGIYISIFDMFRCKIWCRFLVCGHILMLSKSNAVLRAINPQKQGNDQWQ